MKKNILNIILIAAFFAGLAVMLYPTVSNYINRKHSTQVINEYNKILADTAKEDFISMMNMAEDYNKRLSENGSAFFDPSQVSGYNDTLDITGTGVMGYITIEKIGVELPVYHGTDEGVLQIAAGHIEGTSLPVGGKSTHCVLSGHRGLPSARLFTDLDDLENGDTFTINVLDRMLTYKVDRISIVKPYETDELQIVPGMDYCTLMTCTPYGINTHRLLVRGIRTDNVIESPAIFVANEAFRVDTVIVMPIFEAPILFLILIVVILRKKSRSGKSGVLILPKHK